MALLTTDASDDGVDVCEFEVRCFGGCGHGFSFRLRARSGFVLICTGTIVIQGQALAFLKHPYVDGEWAAKMGCRMIIVPWAPGIEGDLFTCV